VIDKNTLKKAFAIFCKENGLDEAIVTVENHATDDDFFTQHKDLQSRHEWLGDHVSFDLDKWFKSENPTVPKDMYITIDVYNSVSAHCLANSDDWVVRDTESDECGEFDEILETMTYSELPSSLKADLDLWWDDLTLEEASIIESVVGAIGYVDLEAHYDSMHYLDEICMLNVFYEPRVVDEDAAFKAKLMPFCYRSCDDDEIFMLSLAGCGMDLSARLDLYQALTSKTLPSDSQAFNVNNKDFFRSVCGVEAEEVLKMCELSRPKVVFEAYVNKGEIIIEEEDNAHKMSFAGYVSIVAGDDQEAILKLRNIGRRIEQLKTFKEFSIEDIQIGGIIATGYSMTFMCYAKVYAGSKGMALEKLYEVVKFYDIEVEDVMFDD
jgi:hypothetical protein